MRRTTKRLWNRKRSKRADHVNMLHDYHLNEKGLQISTSSMLSFCCRDDLSYGLNSIESIPWVRCASGNLCLFKMMPGCGGGDQYN